MLQLVGAMHVKCVECDEYKERTCFTKTQRTKNVANRRCKDCVARTASAFANNTTTPIPSPTAAVSDFSSRGRQQRQRAEQGVRVRVRDVQKHYGHLYEIPLQAYREADVAYSRSDYVTAEDVQLASDAWDARSLAHDIDTQWGEMPWGGAYKDSNHYYDPGEYDFY